MVWNIYFPLWDSANNQCYVLVSLNLRKLPLKRKTPYTFKVSKLISLKRAISHSMLELAGYNVQPFPETGCELDIIFSNMSDIFRGFTSWLPFLALGVFICFLFMYQMSKNHFTQIALPSTSIQLDIFHHLVLSF